MALSNRINFRGGQSQPLGNYLYKDGVDNIALTGGLNASGYSVQMGISLNGNTASFNANDITLSADNVQYNGCILGTNIPVDVTNINFITMKCSYNNIEYVLNADVRSLAGFKYVGFGDEWEPAGVSIFIAVASDKASIVQNNEALGNIFATHANYVGLKVNEILIS